MHIRQLAQRVGLSTDTIRFYEKQGLLDSSFSHRQSNNYRVYGEEAVERLLLIKQAKRYGYRLSELRELSNQWQTSTFSVADKKELLRQKLHEIEQQIDELHALKHYIAAKLGRLDGEDGVGEER